MALREEPSAEQCNSLFNYDSLFDKEAKLLSTNSGSQLPPRIHKLSKYELYLLKDFTYKI